MTSLREPIVRHIENHFFKYIIVLVLFVAGVVMGAVNSFGNASDDVVSIFENLNQAEFDTVAVMKTSFLKNLRYFLLIFIGGFSFWLLPFSASSLFVYGFSYGYTVASLTFQMGWAGFAVAFVSIMAGLLITVPLCTVMCVVAINRNINKKIKHKSPDVAGYIICGLVLFAVNLVVVPADALLIPEIIKQICASVKL